MFTNHIVQSFYLSHIMKHITPKNYLFTARVCRKFFMHSLIALLLLLGLKSGFAQSTYSEGFETMTAYTYPSNTMWFTHNWNVYPDHGTGGYYGLTKNMNGQGQWDEVYMTQSIGPVEAGYSLQFSYRIVQDNNYPNNASTLRNGDSINVEISVNNGPWILLETIDSTNHIPSTSFVVKSYSLSAYAGSSVRLHLYSHGGLAASQNNYWIDVDNIQVASPYCIPSQTHGTMYQWNYNLDQVSINNYNESFANYVSDPYVDVTETTHDLNLRRGTPYKLYVTCGIATGNHIAAFIDFNGDGDFSDSGEKLGEYTNTNSNELDSIAFTVPSGATLNRSRLRLRCSMLISGITSCVNDDYGQTIDINLFMTDYCIPLAKASPSFYMNYIAIDNGSNMAQPIPPFGFLHFPENPLSSFTNCLPHSIKVKTAQSSVLTYTAAAWIDFNDDKDFDDAGEKLGQQNVPATDTATIVFSIPANAANGTHRMRIRAQEGTITNLLPCVDDQKSETTDYPCTINLTYPVVNISGNNSICAGSATTLSATSGYAAYLWSDNSPNTSITVSPTTTTQYSVTVSNLSGCSTTTSVTVTVSPLITPSLAIGASQNPVCTGTTVNFIGTAQFPGNNPGYQWYLDGTPVGGNSLTYSHLFSAAGSYDVYLELTSNAACLADTVVQSSTVTIVVSTTTTPAISIYTTPSTSVCLGDSLVCHTSIQAGGSAPQFEWFIDGISSGSDSTFTSTSLSAANHLISCTLTSNDICASSPTAQSQTLSINVNPVVQPALSIQHSGGTSLCSGSVDSFSATAISGAGSSPVYEWLVDGAVVSGGINYDFVQANAGTYQVACVLHSNETCARPDSAVSSTVNITAEQTPPSPQISTSAGGDSLISSVNDAGFQYTWLLDGQIISTGSQAGIQCTGSGIYSLLLSTPSCSGDTSNVLTVICTGIENNLLSSLLRVYPNPVFDKLRLDFLQPLTEDILLSITDQLGRTIVRETIRRTISAHSIDLNHLTNGIYFLHIHSNESKNKTVTKIVKE